MTRIVPWLVAGGLIGLTAAATAKEWPSKLPSDAERGKELYERHCVACHGVRAAGDGPAAEALTVPVPDLSDGFGSRDRGELIRIVMRGEGAMPAYEQAFRDLLPWGEDYRDHAKAVLDHMEGLSKAPPPKKVPDPSVEEEDEEDLEAGEAQPAE